MKAIQFVALAIIATFLPGCTQSPVRQTPPATIDATQATANYLTSIRDNPPLLVAFMRKLPKGADLHNHLSGAIYAENYLRWAADDGKCIDQETLAAILPPCDAAHGKPPAVDAMHDSLLHRQVIDAWSMRDFIASNGNSGHDHFFDTFGKFHHATQGHRGDMLALAMHDAAQQRITYLELMETLAQTPVRALAKNIDWNPDFAQMRNQLEPGMAQVLRVADTQLQHARQRMHDDLHCGSENADAGCKVQFRYLYQVLRGLSAQEVFAQMLAGFELSSHNPHVVGLNMVMAEDGHTAMHDFNLHMAMLDYLHGIYPQVKISLHAGELAPGMVPPDGLRFHIRASIERGHAQRIGHGVDIMHEDHPFELLHEMAQKNVLVEICLTSNKTILGVSGVDHPLPVYVNAHVPVALATDDAGVSRSTLSREFVEAERQFHLPYRTLKAMVRDSLAHAFVQGADLWAAPGQLHPVTACARDRVGSENPSPTCAAFLANSEKAHLQWLLETNLKAFEAQIAQR